MAESSPISWVPGAEMTGPWRTATVIDSLAKNSVPLATALGSFLASQIILSSFSPTGG